MNIQQLSAAVQEAPWYLERFNRKAYAETFGQYQERFGPLYRAAVLDTAGEETALHALADALLDVLEQGWKAQRPWNRATVRMNEKQVVVAYLSPLLLSLGEPLCRQFAGCLRDRWTLRWPKDSYRIASFERIQKGFRNTIMGIEVPVRSAEKDEDLDEDL